MTYRRDRFLESRHVIVDYDFSVGPNGSNAKKEWPIRCGDGVFEKPNRLGSDQVGRVLARVVHVIAIVSDRAGIIVHVGARVNQNLSVMPLAVFSKLCLY